MTYTHVSKVVHRIKVEGSCFVIHKFDVRNQGDEENGNVEHCYLL